MLSSNYWLAGDSSCEFQSLLHHSVDKLVRFQSELVLPNCVLRYHSDVFEIVIVIKVDRVCKCLEVGVA